MSAKDSYTAPVVCSKCGQMGLLHLSEEDGWAYMRNQAVKVEKIEGDFEAVGQPSGAIKIRCLKCRSKFVMKP